MFIEFNKIKFHHFKSSNTYVSNARVATRVANVDPHSPIHVDIPLSQRLIAFSLPCTLELPFSGASTTSCDKRRSHDLHILAPLSSPRSLFPTSLLPTCQKGVPLLRARPATQASTPR